MSKKPASRSRKTPKAPTAVSSEELKSRIVRAIDLAIIGSAGLHVNGGSYTRSDDDGTYTRPDRTLTRGTPRR